MEFAGFLFLLGGAVITATAASFGGFRFGFGQGGDLTPVAPTIPKVTVRIEDHATPIDAVRVPSRSFSSDDLDFLARTLWGEARGEDDQGKYAVAWIIMNRVDDRRWPNTVEGVCTEKRGGYYAFTAWDPRDKNRAKLLAVNESDPSFLHCKNIAIDVLGGDGPNPIGDATHYANTATLGGDPWWADPLHPNNVGRNILTQKIGGHTFYTGVA